MGSNHTIGKFALPSILTQLFFDEVVSHVSRIFD